MSINAKFYSAAINTLNKLVAEKGADPKFTNFPIYVKVSDILGFNEETQKQVIYADKVLNALKGVNQSGNWPKDIPPYKDIKADVVYGLVSFCQGDFKPAFGEWYFFMDSPSSTKLIEAVMKEYRASNMTPIYWAALPVKLPQETSQ